LLEIKDIPGPYIGWRIDLKLKSIRLTKKFPLEVLIVVNSSGAHIGVNKGTLCIEEWSEIAYVCTRSEQFMTCLVAKETRHE